MGLQRHIMVRLALRMAIHLCHTLVSNLMVIITDRILNTQVRRHLIWVGILCTNDITAITAMDLVSRHHICPSHSHLMQGHHLITGLHHSMALAHLGRLMA